MTMRASLIITAKDQASAQFAKIAAGARAMGAAFRPVAADARAADRAIDAVGGDARTRFARIGAAARKMAGDLRQPGAAFRMLDGAIHGVSGAAATGASRVTRWAGNVRRAAVDMRIGERAAIGLGKAVGHAAGITAGLTIRMGQAALGMAASAVKWGALAAAGGAGWMVAGVIKTAAQFEQFEAVLTTVTGSAAKARQSMDWVQKFAATTPYEMDQVMGAFVKLKAYGIDPTDGSLRSLGDAASAMGKDIESAVEMMADAMTGEFERLKEFGVRASQQGDKVTFRWMKNNKEMTRTTAKNGAAIKKALSDIFDGNYSGAMDRQSKTLVGMWSNLKDMWSGFLLRIARAGIFNRIKASLSNLLNWLGKKAEDGSMDKWAERISDWLEKAWNWGVKIVTETNWKQLAKDVWGIAKAAWSVAIAFRNAVNWWREFSISRDIQMQQGIADGWLTSDADKAKARQRVKELRAELADMRGDPAPSAKTPPRPAAAPVKAPLKPGQQAVAPWKPAPDTASPWTRSSRLAAPAAPGKAPLKAGAKPVAWPTGRAAPAKPVARPARTAASDVKVGGRVEVSIDVKAPAGTQARTTRVASSNPAVPVSAKVGRSMSEAA